MRKKNTRREKENEKPLKKWKGWMKIKYCKITKFNVVFNLKRKDFFW